MNWTDIALGSYNGHGWVSSLHWAKLQYIGSFYYIVYSSGIGTCVKNLLKLKTLSWVL